MEVHTPRTAGPYDGPIGCFLLGGIVAAIVLGSCGILYFAAIKLWETLGWLWMPIHDYPLQSFTLLLIGAAALELYKRRTDKKNTAPIVF